METFVDLVADARDRSGNLLSVPGRTTDYSYADFCTDVWKAGNLFRHYGVRGGADCAVAVGPKEGDGEAGYADAADPLLAILGGAVLGARVDPDPRVGEPVSARALVLPAAWVGRYEAEPGCSVIAYGGPPEAPSVVHFEQERWSENPTQPPGRVEAGTELLGGHTQAELLDAAERVASERGIAAGDRVVVRAPLTTPGTLVAGLVAPMTVGATTVLSGPDTPDPEGETAVTVGGEGLDPAAVIG
jgi:hypothetical protein